MSINLSTAQRVAAARRGEGSDFDELQKARKPKGVAGEERVWGGEKYKKQPSGNWIHVGSALRGRPRPSLTPENLKALSRMAGAPKRKYEAEHTRHLTTLWAHKLIEGQSSGMFKVTAKGHEALADMQKNPQPGHNKTERSLDVEEKTGVEDTKGKVKASEGVGAHEHHIARAGGLTEQHINVLTSIRHGTLRKGGKHIMHGTNKHKHAEHLRELGLVTKMKPGAGFEDIKVTQYAITPEGRDHLGLDKNGIARDNSAAMEQANNEASVARTGTPEKEDKSANVLGEHHSAHLYHMAQHGTGATPPEGSLAQRHMNELHKHGLVTKEGGSYYITKSGRKHAQAWLGGMKKSMDDIGGEMLELNKSKVEFQPTV